MVTVMLVGNVEPQTSAVCDALLRAEHVVYQCWTPATVREWAHDLKPGLIVVAGYRRLIPPDVLAVAPTVGFHSAKLPEYPGRAPVYWTLLRGDQVAWNTMLYLDEGIDSGDVIDSRAIYGTTPEILYAEIARTAAEMLTEHLPGLLDGTAARTPQDPAKRGPLTPVEGWALYHERERLGAGHG